MPQLAFTEAEYRERLRRVQEAMAHRGLGLLLLHTPENICYLTGYQTSGHFAYQVLVVPPTGAPLLLVRYIEQGWVEEYSWLKESFVWRDGEDVIAATVKLVASFGPDKTDIGVETRAAALTVAWYHALCERLKPRRLVDASYLVDRIRTIKSEAEIEYVRSAAACAMAGIRAGMETIRDGATELELSAAIHHAVISMGSEYTGLPQFMRSGYRTRLAHANWSRKVMRRGEKVNMELAGCIARYHAATIRTVCIGAPSDEVRRVADILLSAQDAMIAALKPGAAARDVDAVLRRPVRASLRPDFYNRTGYSIGIGFPPRWGEWDVLDFNEGSDWEVQVGMVFHLVSGAVGPGVAFSETVAIRPHGAERLTTLPRELVVVT